jgi:hypothetical protein
LNDDSAGWIAMQTSFLFNAWRQRIMGAYQELGYSKATNAVWEKGGTVFAHALVTRQDRFADWQGTRFIQNLAGKNNYYHDWHDRSFEMFAAKLYAMLRDVPLDVTRENEVGLGIYQRILDHWHDPDALSLLLVEVCEYHWRETSDLDKLGHVGAFASAPYGMFPVEILALSRVRQHLGLTMPKVDHVLMKSPLSSPPENVPAVQDEILESIIDRARKERTIEEGWKP